MSYRHEGEDAMSPVEKKTVYFKEAGTENTDTVLTTVREYVEA